MSSSPSPSSVISVIHCKRCTNPLFPLTDVITEKAKVWSDTVYSYELEDCLGDSCYCYSATNPGQTRYDVFRVRILNNNNNGEQTEWSKNNLTVKFSTKKKAYSADHSWFPPAKWNFVECASCNNHLGWGFHFFDVDAENDDQNKKDEHNNNGGNDIYVPKFIGCIFSHIVSKDIEQGVWTKFLKQRASVANRIRLCLLRDAWPALLDDFRINVIHLLNILVAAYDERRSEYENALKENNRETEKEEEQKSNVEDSSSVKPDDDDVEPTKNISDRSAPKSASSSITAVFNSSCKTLLSVYLSKIARFENLMHSAASFAARLRVKKEEHPDTPDSELQRHEVPFFRRTISLDGYQVTDLEDEEKNESVQNEECFEVKAIMLLKEFHKRWHKEITETEERINTVRTRNDGDSDDDDDDETSSARRRTRRDQTDDDAEQPLPVSNSLFSSLVRALFGARRRDRQNDDEQRQGDDNHQDAGENVIDDDEEDEELVDMSEEDDDMDELDEEEDETAHLADLIDEEDESGNESEIDNHDDEQKEIVESKTDSDSDEEIKD